MAKILLITDKKLCLEHCIAQKHEITHIEDALKERNSKYYILKNPETKETYLKEHSEEYDFFVINYKNNSLCKIIKLNAPLKKRKIIMIDRYYYKFGIRRFYTPQTKWLEIGEKLYAFIENKKQKKSREYIKESDEDLNYMCNQEQGRD